MANELMGNEFMAVVGTIKELNVSPEYSRTGKLGPENPTEAVLASRDSPVIRSTQQRETDPPSFRI